MNDNHGADWSVAGSVKEGERRGGRGGHEGDRGIGNRGTTPYNIIHRIVGRHGIDVVSGRVGKRGAVDGNTALLGDGIHQGIAIDNRTIIDHVEIVASFVKGEPGVRVVVHGLGGSLSAGAVCDDEAAFGGGSFHNEVIGITGDRNGSDWSAWSGGAADAENVVVRT